MRIVLGLAFGVMFAMDRRPLTGQHRGGQPTPETEKGEAVAVPTGIPFSKTSTNLTKDASLGAIVTVPFDKDQVPVKA